MAKKAASSSAQRVRISGSRAGRLFKLLKVLSSGVTGRAQLVRRLKVGMRTFYRDVDLLRACGIHVQTLENGYSLEDKLDTALDRLPFPDPELTFGDVLQLSKGRSKAHEKLRRLFDKVVG